VPPSAVRAKITPSDVNEWGRSLIVDEVVDHYRADRHPSGSRFDLIVPASAVDHVRTFLVNQERDGTLRYRFEPVADRA
jgi:hypothetical protein